MNASVLNIFAFVLYRLLVFSFVRFPVTLFSAVVKLLFFLSELV